LPGEAPKLENTGERFLPGAMFSAEVAYDHLTRYRLAERYVRGRKTVDLGCGAGYGTYSLTKVTRSILGVDLSEEAVAHDAQRYRAPNLRYEVGDVTNLPYEAGSFEAAVSFEVIEHLQRPEELVLEAKRLLKEDGIFVVSTPDKLTYSVNRNSVNPHHQREMYPLEFQEILERHFKHVRIYRQGALAGSIISPEWENLPAHGPVTMESAQFSLSDPAFGQALPITLYLVAICANGDEPEPLQHPLMILDRDRQIYEEYADHHFLLSQVRTYHNYKAQALRNQMNQRLQQANQRSRQLQRELNTMRSSRSWRIARKVSTAVTKIRGAVRRSR
jgi:SAM-dependent methyltransferase